MLIRQRVRTWATSRARTGWQGWSQRARSPARGPTAGGPYGHRAARRWFCGPGSESRSRSPEGPSRCCSARQTRSAACGAR
eukprot:1178208-Prorocentrum_minimum.AAC.1